MTSIIKLIPFSGSLEETPPCYLLTIDEFCFLLDCGCDESCDLEYINFLKPYIPKIDAVLLSHPDTYHLGALPYLFGKCGLSCDVYATTPVYQMGQMFAYDLYQSRQSFEEFDLFSLDDVDLAFDKVIQVKYNQTVTLKGKGQGMTLTPLPAGHMIGGTIWKILKDGEEDIVYAIDINHKKERHLNGCQETLEKLSRPSMLITDCYNINYAPGRRNKRDSQLYSRVVETVRAGGSVLIATDTAGRVLELSHMLDQFWRIEPGLQAYSLAMLNNFCYNVIEFAKSLVEWMSDKMMRSFEGQRNNPFAFRHMQICHNLTELRRISEPYVILASQPELECGFTRELFFSFCSNPRNMLILTQRSTSGTLADWLFNLMNQSGPYSMKLERKIRVPLAGQELEDYLEKKREEAERERERNANESIAKEEEESEEESDEDLFDEEFNQIQSTAKGSELISSPHRDLMLSSRFDGRVKGGGFFKNAKKSFPMFPAMERKLKWDEYGEIINPDDYAIFDVSRVFMEEKENMITNSYGDDGTSNLKEEITKASTEVPPTKCIVEVEELSVQMRIEFIDFEGRSDGESLKRIIKMIKPRRLIVVRGNEDKASHFTSFCQTNGCLTSEKIFVPKLLEEVDATTERHIYRVKLKDALVSSLRFSRYKDGTQLAWVEGQIDMDAQESILPQDEYDREAKPETSTGNDSKPEEEKRPEIPALKQVPTSQHHQTIFVNELKLSDFKQTLMKHGIQAEFSGGVLLCNGQVEVKRTETGRIHLEGTVSDEYFKIRHLLYDQYAIL